MVWYQGTRSTWLRIDGWSMGQIPPQATT
jgi:hypothetical protein